MSRQGLYQNVSLSGRRRKYPPKRNLLPSEIVIFLLYKNGRSSERGEAGGHAGEVLQLGQEQTGAERLLQIWPPGGLPQQEVGTHSLHYGRGGRVPCRLGVFKCTYTANESKIVDPDPHYFETWIRIRLRVKNWTRICIKVKIQRSFRGTYWRYFGRGCSQWKGWRLEIEPWRVLRPVVADSTLFDEQDPNHC